MKKYFAIMVAVLFCLIMAAPAMACDPNIAHVDGKDSINIVHNHGNSNDGGYAYGATSNSYDATAYGRRDAFAMGGSASTGEVTGNSYGFFGDRVGFSYSAAEVESAAGTFTSPYGKNRSTVSGEVGQANWSDAEAGPGTWAAGGNASGASYKGIDRGCGCRCCNSSGLSGNAETSGFTLTGAYTTGDTSLAGGLTTNHANTSLCDADRGRVSVGGFGQMQSATFAAANNGTSGGSAGTYANSTFGYSANGSHCASGGGIAANGGYSNVTMLTNGGVSATSASGGFASSHSSGR